MKHLLSIILFLTGFAHIYANPVLCFKFTDKTGMSMSDAVCILSNDSALQLSEEGWICFNTYQPITNKLKIRKSGYYDYILYIIWED